MSLSRRVTAVCAVFVLAVGASACSGQESFELQHGKPSATFGGAEHVVGQTFTVDLMEVPQSSVTGIPERCSRGAGDTVLAVE